MTQEPNEETIKRRSENADAFVFALGGAYDWFWIVACALFGIALFAFWLLS